MAWAYDFPTRDLLPIPGMIAFYNEKLDIFLDGVKLERPHTLLLKEEALPRARASLEKQEVPDDAAVYDLATPGPA